MFENAGENQNLQSAIFKWAKELFWHFQICQNIKKQNSVYIKLKY